MKIATLIIILLISVLIFLEVPYAYPEMVSTIVEFQKVNGISESLITALKISLYNQSLIYAGTNRFLYVSVDNGISWKPITTVKAYVNCIYIDNSNDIYAGTDKGLFRKFSTSERWELIYSGKKGEGENVLAISKTERSILIGTQSGLYNSSDFGKTWKSVTGLSSLQVSALSKFVDGIIYAANERGLYKSNAEFNSWEKIYYIRNQDTDETIDSEDNINSDSINSIIFNPNRQLLYIATKKGVFQSDKEGESWQRLPRQGLLSRTINKLAVSSNNELFAATANGLFKLNTEDNIWQKIYKGLSNDEINDIAIDSVNANIFVATSRGLFKSISHNSNKESSFLQAILSNFSNEPSILEIQNQAVKYAEVHPEKIKRWRTLAAKKALLPKLTVDADRYVVDLRHWDAGGNPDVLLKGDDSIQWGVSLTWDFGDLVWSSDQTSIDTRSRLMVQLRQDILDEVNRLYFERRRLQIELLKSAPENEFQRIEKELRVAELTADLDALTGGYFSHTLKQN